MTDFSAVVIQRTAGARLVSGRLVDVDEFGVATYFNPETPGTATQLRGVVKTTAEDQQPVTIVVMGPIVDNDWAWQPGQPVYGIADGELSQTAPATGVVYCVGTAERANALFVSNTQGDALPAQRTEDRSATLSVGATTVSALTLSTVKNCDVFQIVSGRRRKLTGVMIEVSQDTPSVRITSNVALSNAIVCFSGF